MSQQKSLTLKEIWDGTLNTESLEELRSMDNGQEYTVLQTEAGGRTSSVISYSYATSEKTATIVTSGGASGIPYFTTYEFSKDESQLLLGTMNHQIFSRSTQAVYYVYNRSTKELLPVSESKIREPEFSPDGRYVSYVLDNNIYLFDITKRDTRQVTFDGQQNSIINGVADWVYEEEFSLVKAYEWDPAGNRIGFIRFDERNVPEFTMDVFGNALYPAQIRFKYPKAGEDNAFVSLHIFDLESGKTTRVALSQDYYIPRIEWMHNPKFLSVMTLNRLQNRLQLYKVDAETSEAHLLFEEEDNAYLEITGHQYLEFLPGDRFLWSSERDGYNHLYVVDAGGIIEKQLTKGNWSVTKVYGYDAGSGHVYFQSTENGSVNRDLYSVGINGDQIRRLSNRDGTHDAEFSADFDYYIDSFSSSQIPPTFTLHDAASGELLRTIKDNSALLAKLADYRLSAKEYGTLEINGNHLNMWMVKPPDFDPSQSYPLLMFQYSGPGSQEVANSWPDVNDYWHQLLAANGIIVACVDGRGTGFKGRDFEKITYRQLGKYELEDQISSAEKLSELPYIDGSRTGIWGWSYGGFMASNCLFRGSETFEMAIAVAPVTNWRFYDTIYTERYMRTPAENPSGYDENSPLSYASQLQGEYLLVHGSGDDNVHVQNTMRLAEALIQANKQFNWAIYPDRNHTISGGNTRLHLYTMMTDFLKEHL
jgi:dipeptidyl-peptidase-4